VSGSGLCPQSRVQLVPRRLYRLTLRAWGVVLTVMGRGLSDLQGTILVLAYRKRQARMERIATLEADSFEYRVLNEGVPSVDLYYPEVLREHFGFEVRSHWWAPERERPTYGQNFSMQGIGERRYRSAQSSLSRAVARLEARGLVERCRRDLAGLNLTERGVEEAKRRELRS
jgi:hypothetical protein